MRPRGRLETREFTASIHLATALFYGDPVEHEEDGDALARIEAHELTDGFAVTGCALLDGEEAYFGTPDYGLPGDITTYTASRWVPEEETA